MKATIVECVIGVLAFGEENQFLDKVFYPKDRLETAKRLRKIESGIVIDELEKLINKLRGKGYNHFIFENSEMAKYLHEKMDIEVGVNKTSQAGKKLRENLEEYALDLKYMEKPEQLQAQIHKITIELAKIKVKKSIEKQDLLVAQAVQTVDDLDKSLNLFMSRLREWFGLHFPELDRLLEKHETYARLVVKLGTREKFTLENLEKEGLAKNKSKTIVKVVDASMGADLGDDDIAQIQDMSKKILELYNVRQSLENYVDSVMIKVAPNTRAIVGSLIGARLLAISGGLMNLAKLPASTVQVLGAEKALFRSLKTKARPPKHGLIFQHPFIHDAKRSQRGKIARALAGKLSIAARVDAFKGEYIGDKLKLDLENRIDEIKKRYEKPPPISAPFKKSEFNKPSTRKYLRRKKRGSKR